MPANLNDIDRGPAGVRMGENARPQFAGEQLPAWSLAESRQDVSVLSGGLDYDGPCSDLNRFGDPCGGNAGTDGLCVRHREALERGK